jgi:hypothetical protein
MARRVAIPFIVDAVLIEDPAHMRLLEEHADIRRSLAPGGGLIARLLRWRIRETLTVDGRPLPTFVDRSNAERKRRQGKLEADLASLDLGRFDNEISQLALYVAGAPLERELGPLVQQVIGRMFSRGYAATPGSYQASRDLALWWTCFGDLNASRWYLSYLAGDNLECMHATSLAMHNIVDALKNMRKLARHPATRGFDAAYAVRRCLVAPSLLLRWCHADVSLPFLKQPLKRGSLVVYRMRKMHARSADERLAFAHGEWNQCPAHGILRDLLAAVWERARQQALVSVQASARRRAWRPGFFGRLFVGIFRRFDSRRWHRLWKYVGIANLIAMRETLRRDNLHDTAAPERLAAPGYGWHPSYARVRTADGAYNDLDQPGMGQAGCPFGRNVPRERFARPRSALLEPDPVMISHELMTRRAFIPARTLNLLAAAWLQFQVHDWMDHGLEDEPDPALALARPNGVMRVRRTRGDPLAYPNNVTHWWDASQVYGSDLARQRLLRQGREGKLRMQGALLPTERFDEQHPEKGDIDLVGEGSNYWLGLSLIHTLFAREHNAICDHLRRHYPQWSDEQTFQAARLVNAALIAKIHTVEWTPAILAHPTVVTGMHANWRGLFNGVFGRFSKSEELAGIPGSPTEHHSAAYAITEEFTAVYRMHPLLPDELELHPLGASDAAHARIPLLDLSFGAARPLVERNRMEDLLWSFGIAHPGALVLRNYPRALQDLTPKDGMPIDLAAMDILRDRERGVPRYNEFRRLLGLGAAAFGDLDEGDRISELYGGDIDKVDLMVGLYAERERPEGFGFSDTAFRVFVLMASRRLKSDRFFTRDYTPAVYTQPGLDWIRENDMKSVLLRHYPDLAPQVRDLRNAFAPWDATWNRAP